MRPRNCVRAPSLSGIEERMEQMRAELSRSGQDGAGSLKLLSRSAKHGTSALFPIRCNARPIGLYGITDYSLVLLHLLLIALDCRNRYGRLRFSQRHGSPKNQRFA